MDDIQELITRHGGIRPASKATGIPYSTLHGQYNKELVTRYSKPKRVLFMTDTHDHPWADKTHLYHIAKHIKASNQDIIMHGGDIADFPSLCHHVRNDTHNGKQKPTLKDDLNSLHEAIQILTEESGRNDWQMTLGNHENWLWQFEDKNPELFGFAQESFQTLFKSCNWTIHPYQRYVDIGGVNFIHAPVNLMGKLRGGENAAKLATTKSVKDVVFGHTHRFSHHQEAKDGNDVWVTAINGGCTMADGYRPSYATGPLGWFYGVVEFIIEDGHIRDVTQISLKTLKERYS